MKFMLTFAIKPEIKGRDQAIARFQADRRGDPEGHKAPGPLDGSRLQRRLCAHRERRRRRPHRELAAMERPHGSCGIAPVLEDAPARRGAGARRVCRDARRGATALLTSLAGRRPTEWPSKILSRPGERAFSPAQARPGGRASSPTFPVARRPRLQPFRIDFSTQAPDPALQLTFCTRSLQCHEKVRVMGCCRRDANQRPIVLGLRRPFPWRCGGRHGGLRVRLRGDRKKMTDTVFGHGIDHRCHFQRRNFWLD